MNAGSRKARLSICEDEPVVLNLDMDRLTEEVAQLSPRPASANADRLATENWVLSCHQTSKGPKGRGEASSSFHEWDMGGEPANEPISRPPRPPRGGQQERTAHEDGEANEWGKVRKGGRGMG